MPMPHLLLIDDDAQIRRALVRMLGRDFTVHCAADAQSALAMIDGTTRDGARMFDVILCDLHLPAMSGHAFYDEVRRRSVHVAERIVIITGSEPAADDAFAMALGDRYVMKTGPLSALVTRLRHVALSSGAMRCAPLNAA